MLSKISSRRLTAWAVHTARAIRPPGTQRGASSRKGAFHVIGRGDVALCGIIPTGFDLCLPFQPLKISVADFLQDSLAGKRQVTCHGINAGRCSLIEEHLLLHAFSHVFTLLPM